MVESVREGFPHRKTRSLIAHELGDKTTKPVREQNHEKDTHPRHHHNTRPHSRHSTTRYGRQTLLQELCSSTRSRGSTTPPRRPRLQHKTRQRRRRNSLRVIQCLHNSENPKKSAHSVSPLPNQAYHYQPARGHYAGAQTHVEKSGGQHESLVLAFTQRRKLPKYPEITLQRLYAIAMIKHLLHSKNTRRIWRS